MLAEEVDGGQALAALLEDASWARELPASDGFWQLWTRLPQFARLVDQHEYRSWRAAWSSLAQALGRQAERDASVSLQDYLHRSQQEEFEAQPLLSFRHEDGDRLTLTTLHQAKGLEFEVVFIADAVEGVFPDLRTRSSLLEPRLLSPARPTEPALSARFRLQEEMRLAYMGMTRARRRVVCTATSAGYGQQEGGPSRFLLLATGVESAEQLDGRPDPPWPPVTPLEAEAYLRGIARDPRQGPARRLASMAALARGSAYGLRPPHCFVGQHRRGPDVGLVPPDLALSPSQADAYQVCPRRYALERRLGMDGGPGLHAELGALLHRVLEEVERAAMEREEVHGSLADALEELDRAWQPRAFGGGAWAEAWRRRAEAILRNLYGHWPGSSPAIAVEHPLGLRLNGVAWRGRADRIEAADGLVRVVDYKTGKQAASRAEARRSLQLGFYLLAAAHDPALTRHGRPAHAEFWYPARKSKDCTVRTFDPHNLPMVEADLARVAEGILAEDWAPTVGEACDRCPVRLVCPAWPEGREAFLR
ncbi:MAG: PD-(D/E)XK nuclease family protein [Actinomycetota bacterium]|nr:PD-(D/E)XK nuclease family protein [Actinomycetota bacterium]